MLPMKNWSFLPLFVLGICFFALLAPVFCVAQTSPDLEQGLKPYGAYQGGNIDSVGLTNGNVMAHIPMASYPQRGGKLRLNFFARYNNKSWTVGHTSAVPPAYFWTLQGGAMEIVPDQPIDATVQEVIGRDHDSDPSRIHIYSATTVDGGTHLLGLSGPQGTSTGGATSVS